MSEANWNGFVSWWWSELQRRRWGNITKRTVMMVMKWNKMFVVHELSETYVKK